LDGRTICNIDAVISRAANIVICNLARIIDRGTIVGGIEIGSKITDGAAVSCE
jgi:hypothetical protein